MYTKSGTVRWGAVFALAAGFALARAAFSQSPEDIRAVVRAASADSALLAFYERRRYTSAWVVSGRPTPAADSALEALGTAVDHGLDPDAFGHSLLVDKMMVVDALAPADAARLELALTDALLKYAQALLRGKVDPRKIHPGWQVAPRGRDLGTELELAVEQGMVRSLVPHVAPRAPMYTRLQEALVRLRRLNDRGPWPTLPAGAALEVGAMDPAVAVLREQLTALGDLPEEAIARGPEALFDSTLLDAVIQFQRRHGLQPDGVVGRATRAALNVPLAARMHQLALNLERLRWMPSLGSGRFVIINIAGCRLAVVEDGRVVLEMPAIVGATDTPTPVFNAAITGLVMAPTWYVPASIADEEIWPAARQDSTYFARHHMTVLPSGVIKQDPGPSNPLGRLKFSVANPYDIGLHDTPDRRRFASVSCTFSHGCVRLGDPLALAEYVLRGESEWTLERIETTISRWIETPVVISDPIPVFVTYITAWVDDAGLLQLRQDRYGYDATLGRLLGRP
jgi:L,D-transpeptidase YcbB